MTEKAAQVVLLVEDNEDHAALISRAFAGNRDVMELKVAGSMSSATALLETLSPAVILCDYLLSDGTGLELLHRQREGNPSAPPFVLLTSQGDENTAVAAMKAGAADYIVKSETSLMSLPDVCRAIMREHEHRREKARAIEQLDEKQRLNDTLLSALPYPAMLIRGTDRIIIAANKIALQKGAVIGDHCWSSFGKSLFGTATGDDAGAETNYLRTAQHGVRCSICKGDLCLFEEPVQSDAEVIIAGIVWDTHWIKVSASTYLHYAIDITEQHKLQNDLQNLIREQSTVLDTSIVGISKVVNRVTVWANRAMCDLFGYTQSELENAETCMLYPSHDAYLWLGQTAYPQLARGVSFSTEMQMRRKDGSVFWVLLHGNAIDRLRPAEGTVWIFEDITKRRLLEAQLRESQKMESIGQLAGGVAHDFNNILTVIIGYCNLLDMHAKLDGFQKEAVGQIMSSAEKAAQLTVGLLAFSRKQVLNQQLINLNDIVQNVQKFLLRLIGEDVQLHLNINEAQLPVIVDSGQIEQVLINLATNARDAMKRGGLLSIETGLQKMEEDSLEASAAETSRQYACISVSDSGSGMDEDTRSKIFEPFFTTKEVGKGTGLGMAIVHGIVKQHDGFIAVQSELGVGTTFRIFLPVATVETHDQQEHAVQQSPQGGSETILLAEDDVDVRRLETSILRRFGYEVIEAEDGQAAVEAFSANKERIALVLLDVIMPRKNGQEAYEEICGLKPGVKVLFASGYTADFIKNRGVSEEKINLIMKPILPLDLLRKVREMLDS